MTGQYGNLPIIALTVVLVMGLGVLEYWFHVRQLRRIRLRIHVNGTRGKSSVTRLVAAGLRAGGIRTCAKTTGTLARIIMPDGSEYPVFRPSRANIIEQLRIVRAAAANACDALVIECMALQPYLQWLSEGRFIQASVGVITNARADHLDVMGPTERDVAQALAGMVPRGGTLYSGLGEHQDVFMAACEDRKSALKVITEEDVAAITPEDLAGFGYIEHAENLALALRICMDQGVPRQTALAGMWAAGPDPGVMKAFILDFFGRRLAFVNGFAANDPESTFRIWSMSLERFPSMQRRVAVFNCRADRPERSMQLGRAFVSWPLPDSVVLMGSGTYLFARAAARCGFDADRIHFVEGQGVDAIFESILETAGPSALVVGMGNIYGQGMDLVRFFRNRSVLEEQP